jgi:type I restriction enzyme S subunit
VGWRVKKLGDICDFQGGSQPPKSNFLPELKGGYIRLLQIRDFKSDSKAVFIPESKKNRLCNTDDIMIGRYGASVGQIHRGKAGAYNVALIKASPDESVLNRNFLYLYLQSTQFQNALHSVAERSAQAGFSKADIAPFEVALPPLLEQKCIVAILDQAFADIEQARAKTEQNLKNARELFESYLQQVFSQQGEGWSATTLGESCTFSNGKAHENEISENGCYIVVNSRFISQEGRIVKKTNQFLHPLCVGDIAMVMSDVPKGRALAKCFIVDENEKYTLNQRICSISSSEVDTKFLYYQLNRNPNLLAYDNKGSQANLRKFDILSCPVYLPSNEEQVRIAFELDSLLLNVEKLESIYRGKLGALSELKKSILQKAFAGQLTGEQEA